MEQSDIGVPSPQSDQSHYGRIHHAKFSNWSSHQDLDSLSSFAKVRSGSEADIRVIQLTFVVWVLSEATFDDQAVAIDFPRTDYRFGRYPIVWTV